MTAKTKDQTDAAVGARRAGRFFGSRPRLRFSIGLILGIAIGLLFLPAQSSRVNELKDQAAAMQNDLRHKNASISSLKEQVAELQAQVADLNGQIAALKDETAKLKAELRAHRQVSSVIGDQVGTVRDLFRGYGWDVRTKGVVSAAARGSIVSVVPTEGTWMHLGATILLTFAKWRYAPVNGNPWDYNWTCCRLIYNPPLGFCIGEFDFSGHLAQAGYFECIPYFRQGIGYVVQCQDGMFSQSGGRPGGVCSDHGGPSFQRRLYEP